MPHFYERNIVEIKNEYTDFLINIMTPLIYEGVHSMYKDAMSFRDKELKDSEKSEKNDQDVPNVLKIFQYCLRNTPKMNEELIESETNRIRTGSKCSDWFDDLVRAVVKSYIVLLTYNISEKRCDLVEEKLHEKISINHFIHKCYIECAREFYNIPHLFWHKFTDIDVKKNQMEAFNVIRKAIKEAIRKMLPMKLVLTEYLENDYVQCDRTEPNDTEKYNLMKKKVHNHYSEDEDDDEDNNGDDDDYNENRDHHNSGDTGIGVDDLQKEVLELRQGLDGENLVNMENDPEIMNEDLGRIGNNDDDQENVSEVEDIVPKKEGVPKAEEDPEIKKMLNDGNIIKNMPHIKRTHKKKFSEMVQNRINLMNKQIGVESNQEEQNPLTNVGNVSVNNEELQRSEKSAFFAEYMK